MVHRAGLWFKSRVLLVVVAVLVPAWIALRWARNDAVIGGPLREGPASGSVDLSIVRRPR